MWRRCGVALMLLVGGLMASVVVSRGTARADLGVSSTTTVATTTVTTGTTTTVATTTTPPPPPRTTGTTATTTPTRATTTTARKRPTRAPRVLRTALLVSHAEPSKTTCGRAAAVEIVEPKHRGVVLAGPAPRRPIDRLVYPADGSLVGVRSVQVARSCRRVRVDIRSLSLFAGLVTAADVRIDARTARRAARIVVRGLRIRGRTVATGARLFPLGRWGLLAVRGRGVSPLVVRLLRPHAGLPAGTILRVAFFAPSRPRKPARTLGRKTAKPGGPPKVTPPLGLPRYVFPVAGSASFSDSYGAFRADVTGNWHHGDDIFAKVGTPVVAVANGTLNRVGWEPLGGWRLWVRDRRRNEFYYAHLSGYSPQALASNRVKAGEVLGFVGNTGDAFTTPFHLHFEVHPHQLLRLAYDGAVDPTSYLIRWKRVTARRVPVPALPAKLPSGDRRREARFVFGELLAARGLRHREPTAPPRIRLAARDVVSRPLAAPRPKAPARHGGGGNSLLVALLVAVASIAVVAAGAVTADRRRRAAREHVEPAASESG